MTDQRYNTIKKNIWLLVKTFQLFDKQFSQDAQIELPFCGFRNFDESQFLLSPGILLRVVAKQLNILTHSTLEPVVL